VAELDQQPVALLTQRIVCDQPLGATDGRGPPPIVPMPAREPLERLQVELREPAAFVHQPLVVAALQQLTAVRLDRLVEPSLGQRPLELLDVEPQRRVRAPLKRPRPDVDQAVRVRQRAAQVVQDFAQVRVRLALRRVGPQQERQALTRLRRVTVKQEIREQGFGTGRVQRRKLVLSDPEVHDPEQPGAHAFRAHQRAPGLECPLHRRTGYHTTPITGRSSTAQPASAELHI